MLRVWHGHCALLERCSARHIWEHSAVWLGEAQTPHQGPIPGLGMGHSHPSFPSIGAAWRGRRVRAVPGTAFADLVLETWDLHCDRNGREHRTADMGCKQLVVRRGQPFTITLRFSGRGYEEGVDKLSFNVQTGECRRSCVAREGCVGVTSLCPCSLAVPQRLPHVTQSLFLSWQRLVLCTAFMLQGKKVETHLLHESGREVIKK